MYVTLAITRGGKIVFVFFKKKNTPKMSETEIT